MSGLEMKYFVLKPGGSDPHARASQCALLAYAGCIQETNPELASDINHWVARCAEAPTVATETIEIPKKDYDELVEDQELLDALRSEGVDNWDGWSFALERLAEERK